MLRKPVTPKPSHRVSLDFDFLEQRRVLSISAWLPPPAMSQVQITQELDAPVAVVAHEVANLDAKSVDSFETASPKQIQEYSQIVSPLEFDATQTVTTPQTVDTVHVQNVTIVTEQMLIEPVVSADLSSAIELDQSQPVVELSGTVQVSVDTPAVAIIEVAVQAEQNVNASQFELNGQIQIELVLEQVKEVPVVDDLVDVIEDRLDPVAEIQPVAETIKWIGEKNSVLVDESPLSTDHDTTLPETESTLPDALSDVPVDKFLREDPVSETPILVETEIALPDVAVIHEAHVSIEASDISAELDGSADAFHESDVSVSVDVDAPIEEHLDEMSENELPEFNSAIDGLPAFISSEGDAHGAEESPQSSVGAESSNFANMSTGEINAKAASDFFGAIADHKLFQQFLNNELPRFGNGDDVAKSLLHAEDMLAGMDIVFAGDLDQMFLEDLPGETAEQQKLALTGAHAELLFLESGMFQGSEQTASTAELLMAVAPFALAALTQALEEFLSELKKTLRQLQHWLAQFGPAPWILMSIALAAAAHQIIRWRLQRLRREVEIPVEFTI